MRFLRRLLASGKIGSTRHASLTVVAALCVVVPLLALFIVRFQWVLRSRGSLLAIVAAHIFVFSYFLARTPGHDGFASLPRLYILGQALYGMYVPVVLLFGLPPNSFRAVPFPLDMTSAVLGAMAFLLCSTAAAVTYLSLAKRFPDPPKLTAYDLRTPSEAAAVVPADVATALQIVGLLGVGAVLGVLSSRLGGDQTYSDIHATLRGLGGVLMLSMLALQIALVARIQAYSTTGRWFNLAMGSVSVFAALSVSVVTGARNHFINTSLVALAAWSLSKRRITLLAFSTLLLVGYLPGQLGGAFRFLRTRQSVVGMADLIDRMSFVENDFSAVFHAGAVLVDDVRSHSLDRLGGRSYWEVIGRSLPYWLYPDRPMSAAERFAAYVGPRYLREGSAFSMPHTCEAYWNFGWAGCIGIGVLVGLALSAIGRAQRSLTWPTFAALIAISAPHVLWAARADLATIVLRFGILTLLPFLALQRTVRILSAAKRAGR